MLLITTCAFPAVSSMSVAYEGCHFLHLTHTFHETLQHAQLYALWLIRPLRKVCRDYLRFLIVKSQVRLLPRPPLILLPSALVQFPGFWVLSNATKQCISGEASTFFLPPSLVLRSAVCRHQLLTVSANKLYVWFPRPTAVK